MTARRKPGRKRGQLSGAQQALAALREGGVKRLVERIRELQQDNGALIVMVSRQRDELAELRAPKSKSKPAALAATDKPARKRPKVHV